MAIFNMLSEQIFVNLLIRDLKIMILKKLKFLISFNFSKTFYYLFYILFKWRRKLSSHL